MASDVCVPVVVLWRLCIIALGSLCTIPMMAFYRPTHCTHGLLFALPTVSMMAFCPTHCPHDGVLPYPLYPSWRFAIPTMAFCHTHCTRHGVLPYPLYPWWHFALPTVPMINSPCFVLPSHTKINKDTGKALVSASPRTSVPMMDSISLGTSDSGYVRVPITALLNVYTHKDLSK